ncbi:MAG: hypothetical protein U5R06_15160 [candidate division KSB1 bacterium]|nr:hypothetical protein [candidate division KSB1 bacterium]
MKVSLEDIITRVVKEVVAELIRNGVEIETAPHSSPRSDAGQAAPAAK